MRDQAESARRLESLAGDTLVDYFTLYLPVQLLIVDIIGLERRAVPAPTEFCIRAVEAGLVEDRDIYGILGLDASYCERLLSGLCDGDYLGKDAFGRYQVMRRGKELLRQGGEASPSDRRMYVLWDPVQKNVLDRMLVYTRQRTDPDGIIAPIPNAFAQPAADELEIGDINKLRTTNIVAVDTDAPSFEILRTTGIHKSFGRYRQCLALIFTNSDDELTFRLAINGSIDNDLTAACAKIGLPTLIGIDRTMATRPGVQAIRKRHRELLCGDGGGKNVAQLVKRRSVLLFNLRAIEARLAEESVASLEAKKAGFELELNEVMSELERLPVVPVRCHEIDYYLIQALESAQASITITTTNPSAARVDGEILGRLRSCLARGVQIALCISDRFGDNDATLATLDKLSQTGSLTVNFLQNEMRSVFEIEWDGKHLVFSNEPPLGHRRRPIVPREFSGYFVSDEQAIGRYRKSFLNFEPKDFLVRIRPTIANVAAASKSKQRKKAARN
ncbi:hypothetical protein [Paraburkholderia aspalathi]|uniref:hypothetical protein n=1 Tax=Paraburkholderia aspalathi TaxID=1324617 RepID=UPI0038B8ED86